MKKNVFAGSLFAFLAQMFFFNFQLFNFDLIQDGWTTVVVGLNFLQLFLVLYGKPAPLCTHTHHLLKQ